MTPSRSVPFLVVLVCTLSVCVLAQDVGVSLSVLDNEIDVDIEALHDPCEVHKCPTGEECVTVFSPELMRLPIAHCVESQTSINEEYGPCEEYEVTHNILNCKSEDEWKKVGKTQCMLRDNKTPQLTETQVQYRCPRFESTSIPKYLTAIFTCCLEDYSYNSLPTTVKSPSSGDPKKVPPTKQYDLKPPGSLANAAPDKDKKISPNKNKIQTFLIPTVLGLVILLGSVALLLAVCRRRRSVHKNAPYKPQMVFATSFVNPSADQTQIEWTVNPLDSTDKSLLIGNECISPSK